MTENEVFEHVSNLAGDYKCFDEKLTHEESLILCNLIEEIQQYRTIGTADEIKSEHKELIELSRRYLKDTNELIKYQAIGTVEEFKALKEKNTAKKISGKRFEEAICPRCESELFETYWAFGGIHYCSNCGQAIDWQ